MEYSSLFDKALVLDYLWHRFPWLNDWSFEQEFQGSQWKLNVHWYIEVIDRCHTIWWPEVTPYGGHRSQVSHHMEDLHTIFLVVTVRKTVDPVWLGYGHGEPVVRSGCVGCQRHDGVELGCGARAEGWRWWRGDRRVDTVTMGRHRGPTLCLLVSLGQFILSKAKIITRCPSEC